MDYPYTLDHKKVFFTTLIISYIAYQRFLIWFTKNFCFRQKNSYSKRNVLTTKKKVSRGKKNSYDERKTSQQKKNSHGEIKSKNSYSERKILTAKKKKKFSRQKENSANKTRKIIVLAQKEKKLLKPNFETERRSN